MESAKNHHHHHHELQDQVVGSSPSSLGTPSNYYGVGTTTNAWSTTPTYFLETNNGFTLYPSEQIMSSRQPRNQENTLLLPQYTSSNMVPGLAFHNWANQSLQQDLQPPRIKEQISDHYYRKYADLLTSNEHKNLQSNDFKLMLKSLSSEIQIGSTFPSVNALSVNQMGLTNAGSLDMNLEALDLLTSSSFSGNFGSSSQNQVGISRDGFSNYGMIDYHMQQSDETPFYGSPKIPDPVSNGSTEPKRSSDKMEEKAPLQNVAKKSRSEGRVSCPPFKVRKEKLGDRIAALQQIVAPFGKTDTASVLKEAIGYIKFLQDQVETLSVPYMKASRNKSGSRVAKEEVMDQNDNNDGPNRDLRSRGLCLVPLSCLSYIAEGGGGVVWPPPHFGGPV